jgi:hypothetical protein
MSDRDAIAREARQESAPVRPNRDLAHVRATSLEFFGAQLDVAEHDTLNYPGGPTAWRFRSARRSYAKRIEAASQSHIPPKLTFSPPAKATASFNARRLAYQRAVEACDHYARIRDLPVRTREILDARLAHLVTVKDANAMSNQIDEWNASKRQRAAERRAGIVRHYPRRKPAVRSV